MIFCIYPSTNGQYYFTIESGGNYKVLATSETYHRKADAQHAIDLIKAGASSAAVVDLAKTA